MGNPVVHFELMSKNPEKVSDFYAKTFGWKVKHMPEINYRVVDTAMGVPVPGINGGIVKPDKPEPWPGNMLSTSSSMTSRLTGKKSKRRAARFRSKGRKCPAWASSRCLPTPRAA
jgi:hypothetical protein